jgi:hypothetical protein
MCVVQQWNFVRVLFEGEANPVGMLLDHRYTCSWPEVYIGPPIQLDV